MRGQIGQVRSNFPTDGYDVTFAEIPFEEKTVSHRANSFKKFVACLWLIGATAVLESISTGPLRRQMPLCDFNSHVAKSIDQSSWKNAYLREIDRYAG